MLVLTLILLFLRSMMLMGICTTALVCMGMNRCVHIKMAVNVKSQIMQVCTLPKQDAKHASQNNQVCTSLKKSIYF